MTLVHALILTLACQDAPEPSLAFPVGTSWTYRTTYRGREYTTIVTVAKQADGKTHLKCEQWRPKAPDAITSEQTVVEKDGFIYYQGLLGGLEAAGEETPLAVYKVGSKKGDSWVARRDPVLEKERMAVHEGRVEVTVPAGTYKDAVHVSIDLARDSTLHLYFVPKIGLVKAEARKKADDGTEELRLGHELKEMKEAK